MRFEEIVAEAIDSCEREILYGIRDMLSAGEIEIRVKSSAKSGERFKEVERQAKRIARRMRSEKD